MYCVGWDLADLLENGFTGAPAKVESGPARHFRSALGQVVNFFYTLKVKQQALKRSQALIHTLRRSFGMTI